MNFIIEGAGIFLFPLGLLSFMALYVFIERSISLRAGIIIPKEISEALISGDINASHADPKTSIGRIIYFYRHSHPNAEALKAFAQIEMTRLERGMFLLDVAVTGAPLLGLLGTVSGLVAVFSGDGGMPTQEMIAKGVGLALSTTILGLAIAIPSLLGSSYLYRKIDTINARISICVERLIDMRNKSNSQ